MSIITVLILGIAIFAVLRILMYFAQILSRGFLVHKTIMRIMPVFEFIVWAAYVFWAVYMVFSQYSFMPALITTMTIILCIVIGWYVLRDLFSGMILKSESAFELGQHLKTDTVEGMVKRIRYLSIELETTEGEYVKIPYSRLANQMLIRPQPKQSHKYALIKLEIHESFKHTDIREKIIKAINSTPWVIYNRQPELIIKPLDNKLIVEIRFVAFSDEHTNQLKKYLEEFSEKTFNPGA